MIAARPRRCDISRFTLTNVHLFTPEHTFGPLTSLGVENGVITGGTDGEVVDGRGGYLLPGLIDTHVHIGHADELAAGLRWGVTTMLDMASTRWDELRALRDNESDDRSDVRGVSYPACAVRGRAVRKMGFPASTAVSGPADAARWVAERLRQEPDFLKIVLEDKVLPFQPRPLSPATVAALVTEAHRAGKKVVVHAASPQAYATALDAGADVITHAPISATLSADLAGRVASSGTAVSPTLVMMRGVLENLRLPFRPKSLHFGQTLASTAALNDAGATIVLGTDANSDVTSPSRVAHGSAVHEELALLVDAGLSPADALAAATSRAAAVFGLHDRGVLATGTRADLLLLNRNPLQDITASRDIAGVWKRGVAAPGITR
ncbi:amidohydrolase family protein [Lentzea sp. NBC_00516]|uniref:amidohydrolase family protein n=1 Tax=Lentzea sp. NBC_00516 TaxID=2903582 RepID=UPI002E815F49|nr:amidohydrolase family protein [Lentzea sp. NBC_00516]WUD26915.1 amidohydrolase family protein [Lentzea sp. NBC_00516]